MRSALVLPLFTSVARSALRGEHVGPRSICVREGVCAGDDRARMLQLHGAPRRHYADADWSHYGDIGFRFDGRGQVGRMYVRNRR